MTLGVLPWFQGKPKTWRVWLNPKGRHVPMNFTIASLKLHWSFHDIYDKYTLPKLNKWNLKMMISKWNLFWVPKCHLSGAKKMWNFGRVNNFQTFCTGTHDKFSMPFFLNGQQKWFWLVRIGFFVHKQKSGLNPWPLGLQIKSTRPAELIKGDDGPP